MAHRTELQHRSNILGSFISSGEKEGRVVDKHPLNTLLDLLSPLITILSPKIRPVSLMRMIDGLIPLPTHILVHGALHPHSSTPNQIHIHGMCVICYLDR